MKIVAVRIGDRYGPEYETYLESKLPEYEFIWIRKPLANNILLQWNKIYGMTLDIDEPICVIDIDILLINDYKKIFDYPIKRGQFLAAPSWWRILSEEESKRFSINGGFYKYYPKECNYIYKKFIKNPEYWQKKYIEEGFTTGPVNGEQFFMEDSVKEKLKLITLPDKWFCRMYGKEDNLTNKTLRFLNNTYKNKTGNPYMFLGNQFHSDIKYVHFTNMNNHPHKWKDYSLFV
jgi:hypothetical protein